MNAMLLVDMLQDPFKRQVIAAAAVAEGEVAVRERTGASALAAQLGLELINRLRPGFLERHVHAMLPDLALALDPYWALGLKAGHGCGLEGNADAVTTDLLHVVDVYVGRASDPSAIAVYNRLRPRAQERIVEQIPRISGFIARHAPPDQT